MRPRPAVLLTAPTVDPRLSFLAQFLCNVSPFRINTYESVSKQTTLTTFRMNTYEKQAGWGRDPARSAVLLTPPRSFHLAELLSRRHCASVSSLSATFTGLVASVANKGLAAPLNPLDATLTKNMGVGAPTFDVRTFRRSDVQTAFSPPATLFHPWHANASANTSSPISIGAKRLRALSEFRRTPPCLSPGTTNIAGSKLVRGTVK